ncbi:hypothetical protein CIG75_19085 [Tumebacillus algifaecis]|uniref:Uncharacterized protein n=1 Tax=Tumebacillus algifaecis TaxID=1214604 RepID=A0A223D5G7_9BACL|nr:hypothetical protein [Tumebacillus algifaecis]ASS76838.1 hypothetical protein CIG75_19085 [Tumebacillus algifaecis]
MSEQKTAVMTKAEMKEIRIVEVAVHSLSSSQDVTGEYQTNCNVDFIMSNKIMFVVFDQQYEIDRIKMTTDWEEVVLYYANAETYFECFKVSKHLIHKVHDQIVEEQRNGVLDGWSFDDDVMGMLRGE